MSLIKEDGTGANSEANTYAEVSDLRMYAELRGADLPVEDTECEVLLIKAMDYLEGLSFKGEKAETNQPLAWPRKNAWGISMPQALFPSNEIPRKLEYAQLSLAIEATKADLLPSQTSNQGAVIKKKIEGIEVAYSAAAPTEHFTPAFAGANRLLSGLLERNGLSSVTLDRR